MYMYMHTFTHILQYSKLSTTPLHWVSCQHRQSSDDGSLKTYFKCYGYITSIQWSSFKLDVQLESNDILMMEILNAEGKVEWYGKNESITINIK